ncbi:hypothetical protein EDB84DRAFT_1530501, partial [Lactarius hengduanensis]
RRRPRPPHSPPPLLRIAGTHNHPDGPMLGFVILEHDDVDHSLGASAAYVRAFTSSSQGLSFDLTSSIAAAKDRSTGAGTDTGAGEYAGNGTIDASMLGGGGNLSSGKLGDDQSSPVRKLAACNLRARRTKTRKRKTSMGSLALTSPAIPHRVG